MASFCEKDITDIVRNVSKNTGRNKRVNRIRSGISHFLESVCDDIIELYPNIYRDNDLVMKLFKRLLENNEENMNKNKT